MSCPAPKSPAVDQKSARTIVSTDIGVMQMIRDFAERQSVTVGDLILLRAQIRIGGPGFGDGAGESYAIADASAVTDFNTGVTTSSSGIMGAYTATTRHEDT